MAHAKIPTALAMRELKYGGSDDARRDAIAQSLRSEGRRAEAVLLFEGRGDHPFLTEELSWGVTEGNAFHLLSVQRLGREISPEEFRACARAACDRGRWMDARHCYLATGDDAALQEIADRLPESLRPEPPAPDSAE
jgi:hypothetical protein